MKVSHLRDWAAHFDEALKQGLAASTRPTKNEKVTHALIPVSVTSTGRDCSRAHIKVRHAVPLVPVSVIGGWCDCSRAHIIVIKIDCDHRRPSPLSPHEKLS